MDYFNMSIDERRRQFGLVRYMSCAKDTKTGEVLGYEWAAHTAYADFLRENNLTSDKLPIAEYRRQMHDYSGLPREKHGRRSHHRKITAPTPGKQLSMPMGVVPADRILASINELVEKNKSLAGEIEMNNRLIESMRSWL